MTLTRTVLGLSSLGLFQPPYDEQDKEPRDLPASTGLRRTTVGRKEIKKKGLRKKATLAAVGGGSDMKAGVGDPCFQQQFTQS